MDDSTLILSKLTTLYNNVLNASLPSEGSKVCCTVHGVYMYQVFTVAYPSYLSHSLVLYLTFYVNDEGSKSWVYVVWQYTGIDNHDNKMDLFTPWPLGQRVLLSVA